MIVVLVACLIAVGVVAGCLAVPFWLDAQTERREAQVRIVEAETHRFEAARGLVE